MFNLSTILLFCLFNAAVMGGLLIAVLYSAKANLRSRALLATIIGLALWNGLISVLIAENLDEQFPVIVRTAFLTRTAMIIVFYFYVQSLIHTDFKISKQSPLHLIPLAIGLLWFALPWIGDFPQLLHDRADFFFEAYLLVLFRFVISMIYVVLLFRVIRTYEQQVKSEFSTVSDFKLTWLRSCALIFAVALIVLFFDVITGPKVHIWVYNPIILAGSLCLFTYVALRTSRLPTLDYPDGGPPLTDPELQRLKDKLMTLMHEKGAYLNSQLRLKDVADLMGTKSYKITEVINRGCGTNFNELINALRTQHAKKLLTDPAHNHESILAIAFESGFSSKSAFNEIFKKNVGMTPSRFRLRGATESTSSTVRTSELEN